MNTRNTPPLLFRRVDDAFLIEAINSAEKYLELIIPGISVEIAQALIQAYERLNGNVKLIMDVSAASSQIGINNAQAVIMLQRYADKNTVASFRCEKGLKIASLTADDETFCFVPEAMLSGERAHENINALLLSDSNMSISRPMGQMNITDVSLDFADISVLSKEEMMVQTIAELQRKLEEREEKISELIKTKGKHPIQQNLKFIELEIRGCHLSEQKLNIPSKFLTQDKSVNDQLKSQYSIFTDKENFKTFERQLPALRDFMCQIDDLREGYTYSLGRWKKVILESERKFFESKRDYFEGQAKSLIPNLSAEIKNLIEGRLCKLFITLEPQIRYAYNNENKRTDITLFEYFLDSMSKEIERVYDYFNPQVSVIYKEISEEDATNPEFYLAVEKVFGKNMTARLFSEPINE